MGNNQSYEEEVMYNDTITRYRVNRYNDYPRVNSYGDLAFSNDHLDIYKTQYLKSKQTFSYKMKLCMKKLFSCHKSKHKSENRPIHHYEDNYDYL